MSEGFWSLRNAPAWWFSKRAWVGLAVVTVILLGSRWYHGPARVPAGQVVFYSTSGCAYSTALREHLIASKIPYIERNIGNSFDNLVRFTWAVGKGGGVPVVQVGPKVVAKGFYLKQIDDALTAAGYHPARDATGPEGFSPR